MPRLVNGQRTPSKGHPAGEWPLEKVREKCAAVFRPEVRRSKDLERDEEKCLRFFARIPHIDLLESIRSMSAGMIAPDHEAPRGRATSFTPSGSGAWP